MKVITCFIDDTGVTFLMDENVKMFEGEGEVRRASHVEPDSLVFRIAFHALRRVFGDKGRMSNFTRSWPCLWRIDTSPVGGPVLEQRYRNRQAAIDAEIAFFNGAGQEFLFQ